MPARFQGEYPPKKVFSFSIAQAKNNSLLCSGRRFSDIFPSISPLSLCGKARRVCHFSILPPLFLVPLFPPWCIASVTQIQTFPPPPTSPHQPPPPECIRCRVFVFRSPPPFPPRTQQQNTENLEQSATGNSKPPKIGSQRKGKKQQDRHKKNAMEDDSFFLFFFFQIDELRLRSPKKTLGSYHISLQNWWWVQQKWSYFRCGRRLLVVVRPGWMAVA